MTKGERLVRVSFNPSGNEKVDYAKREFATLLDRVDAVEAPEGADSETKAEVGRAKAVAITHLQTASMFTVSALTAS